MNHEYFELVALFVIALVLIWGFGPLRKQAILSNKMTMASMTHPPEKKGDVNTEGMEVNTPARLY